jgi:2'-5' RNA ligase
VRLFTGIELGDAARTEVAALIATLRKRVEDTAPAARLTWVAAERVHLTVRFIGEVDDATAGRVIGALRAPLRMAPFTLTFDRLGTFPPKGPPRVFWVGVAEGRDAVVRAEDAITERLAAVGIPRGERGYSPHLTLARVRDARDLRGARLLEDLVPKLGATRVDAVTLFQSRPSPRGPTYTVLERTPLRDG